MEQFTAEHTLPRDCQHVSAGIPRWNLVTGVPWELLTDRPALSIRQPWTWLLVHDSKDVENRSWTRRYRGIVLLHAGTRVERHTVTEMGTLGLTLPETLPTGGVVGTARLVDIHHATDCHADGRYCSPWADPDQYHWVLADRRPLPHLVPCTGQQGLWAPFPTDATPNSEQESSA